MAFKNANKAFKEFPAVAAHSLTGCPRGLLRDQEGAPTAGSARGLPAGSTAGPSSFVRDFFGNGLTCPRGARGAYRGVARGGSTLQVGFVRDYFDLPMGCP